MSFWRRSGPIDRAAVTLLALLVLGALLVPALSRQDPLAIGDVLALRLLPPGARDVHGVFHWLGTDRFGRDAGRVSLAVGLLGSLLASGVGTIAGAIAAWSGGIVDRTLMAVADALLAIPRLVLLLVCVHLSWEVSRLEEETRTLAEDMALLRAEREQQ